jgi:hypothetical protein
MATDRAMCGSCGHFRNDAAYLETVFAGLTSLSSGYGSVRADDGVCLLHDRYLSARASCASHAARDGTADLLKLHAIGVEKSLD